VSTKDRSVDISSYLVLVYFLARCQTSAIKGIVHSQRFRGCRGRDCMAISAYHH